MPPPEIQIDFRKGRSTKSVLFLLTSPVEKVCKKGIVASLLSLDISEAYNRVLQEILKKILEEKEFPAGLLTGSFLSLLKGKPLLFLMIQSLLFFQYTVESPKVHLSLLFYFFSNVSALDFADDTNLLAFSPSLKSNLLKLKSTYSKCLDWARKHRIKFTPEKYELLYFSRRRTDNLQLSLRLGDVVL